LNFKGDERGPFYRIKRRSKQTRKEGKEKRGEGGIDEEGGI